MELIVQHIENIGRAFASIMDFIISTVKGLADVVMILSRFMAYLPDYFLWLPDSILAILVAIFAGAVFYKIMGRDG